MSKGKTVIMKDESVQTGMDTTTSSKGSHHPFPRSNESLEDKRIVSAKDSHDKAIKFLEGLENIINTQENSDEILMRLYAEVREMGDMKGNPNYLEWISSTIQNSINAEKSNESYLKFKIIQFFEDSYNGYYCIDDEASKQHEELFKIGIGIAYKEADVNVELKEVLGDLYFSYLEDLI